MNFLFIFLFIFSLINSAEMSKQEKEDYSNKSLVQSGPSSIPAVNQQINKQLDKNEQIIALKKAQKIVWKNQDLVDFIEFIITRIKRDNILNSLKMLELQEENESNDSVNAEIIRELKLILSNIPNPNIRFLKSQELLEKSESFQSLLEDILYIVEIYWTADGNKILMNTCYNREGWLEYDFETKKINNHIAGKFKTISPCGRFRVEEMHYGCCDCDYFSNRGYYLNLSDRSTNEQIGEELYLGEYSSSINGYSWSKNGEFLILDKGFDLLIFKISAKGILLYSAFSTFYLKYIKKSCDIKNPIITNDGKKVFFVFDKDIYEADLDENTDDLNEHDKTLEYLHKNRKYNNSARIIYSHNDNVNNLTISQSNDKIISGSIDGTIKIWDVNLRKVINELNEHSKKIQSLSLTNDNQILVSSAEDSTIRIWDAHLGKQLDLIDKGNDPAGLVCVSSCGTMVAEFCSDHLKIYKIK